MPAAKPITWWTHLRAVAIAAGIALVAFGCGAGASTSTSKQEVVFGSTISLSGVTADYGLATRQGIELAINEYNSGTGKYHVKYVVYDDQTKPDVGLQLAQRLLFLDKAVVLLGGVNSGVALAQSQLVQSSEVPYIVIIGTAVDITRKYQDAPKNYTFRVSVPDDAQVQILFNYLKKHNITNIGVSDDSSGFGANAATLAATLAKGSGIRVAAGPIGYQAASPDLSPVLQQMRAAGVSMLMNFSSATDTATLLKDMAKIGWRVPIISTWALLAPSFMQVLGDPSLAAGTLATDSFTCDHSAAAKAFCDRAAKAYGKLIIPVATAQAYDATKMSLEALDRVGPNPQKIRDAIENLQDFQAVTSIPKHPYTKTNHEALGIEDAFLAVFDNKGNLSAAK